MKFKKNIKDKQQENNKTNHLNHPSDTSPNGTGSSYNLIYYFAIAFILIFSYFLRSKFFEIPFERDEGAYTYYAQLILDGKNLYTSFDAMKFPGIYYAYALIISLFGNTVSGVHLGLTFINLITIFWIVKVGELLFNKITGLIIGISFVFISLAPGISGFTTQSEHFIAFCFAGGLLYAIKGVRSQKLIFYAISGLLIGFSIMVKQSAVFYILLFGIYILAEHIQNTSLKWQQKIISLSVYSVAVFVPFIVGCLIVLKQGVWDDFVFWTLEYPKTYASEISLDRGLELLKLTFNRFVVGYEFFWYTPVLGLILSVFSKKFDIKTKIFFWLMAMFGFLTVVPGFRFYGHYWLQLTPVLAILIGLTYYSIITISEHFIKNNKIVITVLSLIFGMIIYQHTSNHYEYYFKPDYTKVLRQTYGLNPFPEAKIIGDYIRKNTEVGDQILVLGSEPQIYFYTDRRCPSRHAYGAHLVSGHEKHKEWQEELINDVENNKPKYLIFFNHSVSWLYQKDADKKIFDWYNAFSKEHYQIVGLVDIVTPFQTNYVWENDLRTYKPQGKDKVFYI
jgi:hypothetical protein